MKNSTNTIISVILAICVVVLFVLHFTDKNSAPAPRTVAAGDSAVAVMPLAYINLDSLLTNYEYSKHLQDEFMKKAESNQATLNEQGRALESEMRDFQRKVENNAFFDQDRAKREQERILKRQQEFQELNQKLNNQMLQDQNAMNIALRDTIMSQVKTYNALYGHYQLILSNSLNDNILYSDDLYDITAEVIEYMNKQYAAKKD